MWGKVFSQRKQHDGKDWASIEPPTSGSEVQQINHYTTAPSQCGTKHKGPEI